MAAKMVGKPHRGNSRPDWDAVRVEVMRWVLRVKLSQNWEVFGRLLLSTEQRPIVEESARDTFWGAKPTGVHILLGQNVLGRLLMELRSSLLSEDRHSLRQVMPLEIPNFTLYGEAIGIIEDGPPLISSPRRGHPKAESLQQQRLISD